MNSKIKTSLIKAILVKPLENSQLQILLENGQSIILDLKNLIKTKEKYWRLKNPRYFRQVKIDPLGGIFWPNGEDLAPDGLARYHKHSLNN